MRYGRRGISHVVHRAEVGAQAACAAAARAAAADADGAGHAPLNSASASAASVELRRPTAALRDRVRDAPRRWFCRVSARSRPPLAAKVSLLPGMSAWARAQLAEEVSVWSELCSVRHGLHPNIVRFVGSISSADRHVAILERAVGGELFERIIKLSHFDEATAARQVSQVLSAVDHLHLTDRPSRPQAREPAPRLRR